MTRSVRKIVLTLPIPTIALVQSCLFGFFGWFLLAPAFPAPSTCQIGHVARLLLDPGHVAQLLFAELVDLGTRLGAHHALANGAPVARETCHQHSEHGNLTIVPIIQVLLGVVLAQQLLADPGGQVRVIFDVSSRFTSVLRHRCQRSLTFDTLKVKEAVTATRTGGKRNVIFVNLGVNIHKRIVMKRTIVFETSPTQKSLVAVHRSVSGESGDAGSVNVLDKICSRLDVAQLLEFLDEFLHGSIVWILIGDGLKNDQSRQSSVYG